MQIQREMERTRDKTVYTLVKPVETEPESTDNMTADVSSRPTLEPEDDANPKIGPP